MNQYLEKIALNKLEQYVVQNLEKFPMAARKKLADKGMIRSLQQVARGNKERDLALLQKQFGEDAGKRLVLNDKVPPYTTNYSYGRLKGLFRTHEVAEQLEKIENDKLLQARLSSIRQTQIYPTQSFNPTSSPVPISGEVDRYLGVPDKWLAPQAVRELVAKLTKQHTASHHNLAVLGRESNALRQNLYPEVLAPNLANERRLSSEADLVSRITGKQFGKDRLSNQDLRKLRVLPPEQREELAFYTGLTEPGQLKPIPVDWKTLRAWKRSPGVTKYVKTEVRE